MRTTQSLYLTSSPHAGERAGAAELSCFRDRTSKHYPQMVVHPVCGGLQGKFHSCVPSRTHGHHTLRQDGVSTIHPNSPVFLSSLSSGCDLGWYEEQLLTPLRVMSLHRDQPLCIRPNSQVEKSQAWLGNRKGCVQIGVTALWQSSLIHRLALTLKLGIMMRFQFTHLKYRAGPDCATIWHMHSNAVLRKLLFHTSLTKRWSYY